MLAVQHSSMGSSRPPNLDLPFGYTLESSSNPFPFPSPTAPAPGPSLLDDNESKYLDNFFDGVNSDHFNFDFFPTNPDGSELGFAWDELPPTFMGTASSFGQQPSSTHAFPEVLFNAPPPPQPMINPMNLQPAAPASADVLAAATLLQNGSGSRYHMGHSSFHGHDALHPLDPMGLHGHDVLNGQAHLGGGSSSSRQNGHMRPQYASPRPPLQSTERLSEDDFMHDTFHTDLIFGLGNGKTMNPQPPRKPRPRPGLEMQWGSDAGFGIPQGFVASTASAEHIAESERERIRGLEQVFRPSSVDTHSSSPGSQNGPSTGQSREEPDSAPRKRRQSRAEDEVAGYATSPGAAAQQKNAKKRKTARSASGGAPVAPESNGKRRKSVPASSAVKLARENLTEDQKRENHIKSEQKRRSLIREGFDDLGELVPGLRGGGFSKSAVLIMSAEWLEDLLKGNEVLKTRLAAMHNR